ncbi:MAG: hypothetical protein EAZ74_05785 [Alphaproteobacteria bacterium]|nr:MAG: hypothetical protein EAY76_03755 [Alphaproteobacteria bacterium]TAF13401.1 MAG: hypothetical protein EAZ74_05785 [Alphaproteobacteria bacterium]TAF41876.1 MAG: hypothetical protein EAZ66_00660 [Alphaproteobacteria bacterium]TAF77217.1 MAG: hypothetical protein EAZ52_01395 [Alphaproteobacteria bacterium]
MDEKPKTTSIAYALYELKNQDPQAYAGVQKFIQTIAPKIEPSENNPHFNGKQALASLLVLQNSVAYVDSGIYDVSERMRHGEQNLQQEFLDALDRVTALMGGEERYDAVHQLISNQNNIIPSEPMAQPTNTKWQDFVKQQSAQTAMSVNSL